MEHLKTLKSQVEYVLQKYPEARKNDTDLTWVIWVLFFPKLVSKNESWEFVVRLKDLKKLPKEDNVKRIRCVFQNDKGKYLPDWETYSKRMRNSKNFQKKLYDL